MESSNVIILILWTCAGGLSFVFYKEGLNDYNENWAGRLKFYIAHMNNPWKKRALLLLWHMIGGPFYWGKFIGTITYNFLMRFVIKPTVKWLAR